MLPRPNQIHCLRLTPDQDLKLELIRFCSEKNIHAGAILSAVGSLKKLNLRLANSSSTLNLAEKFEIVSVTGTLSINGCHIHISAADSKGHVIGGHLLNDNIIFTTCELVILQLEGYEFKRQLDPATTFNELQIHLTKS